MSSSGEKRNQSEGSKALVEEKKNPAATTFWCTMVLGKCWQIGFKIFYSSYWNDGQNEDINKIQRYNKQMDNRSHYQEKIT